ncbi:MAG TPA: HEPN domain-containing protein [Saprospiraceae bacterium]|nr:HEPN domain-containing protein [Saprospiraceae bacterium]HMQ83883.1 HEPN domain-containing protein [Saprospiraceae bacterium]
MTTAIRLTNTAENDRKDTLELQERIGRFRSGQENEERFRHYRLTRGVYGQRQIGVQMIRIKIPYGKLTPAQLRAMADITDLYSTGNLHITTRQNIQIHFVKLEDSPKVWDALSIVGLTARESCGNTVRNLTASPTAGIDPNEPFDVSPYVQATFEYFLRNPICQDMGRKIKPAFSSSEKDSAFTYFHDFGFIPRIRTIDNHEVRGFKVVVGGGLGAVSMVAPTAYEFLEEDRIIPFMEAALRVFDRYGEREKRHKARMKFLIKQIGLEKFLELVATEEKSLLHPRITIPLNHYTIEPQLPALQLPLPELGLGNDKTYLRWKATNTFEQKQKGFYALGIKVPLGNISSDTARQLADLIEQYAADDFRLTVNQGILLRFVRPEHLPVWYKALANLELHQAGFDSIADITSCPGTDTCALGVTNSTGLASVLEETLLEEFDGLLEHSDIRIKISGCMNSCGQHMAAHIGFHGSSFKIGEKVAPAMQVVLGGGVSPDGVGFVAEKVIKIPTRRIPNALRTLLFDFEKNNTGAEGFNDYFYRQGKKYFYTLLTPFAQLDTLTDLDFVDWGSTDDYLQSIGVGECAGVTLDVVGTIINDARDKLQLAEEAFAQEAYADSIYHAYTAFIVAAKALLLSEDIRCNTHIGILDDFQTHFVANEKIALSQSFPDWVQEMKKQVPTLEFAQTYLQDAQLFFDIITDYRSQQLRSNGKLDKLVVDSYYKA